MFFSEKFLALYLMLHNERYMYLSFEFQKDIKIAVLSQGRMSS